MKGFDKIRVFFAGALPWLADEEEEQAQEEAVKTEAARSGVSSTDAMVAEGDLV